MAPASSPTGSPPPGAQWAHGVAYRIVRAMFVVIFFWVFWKFGGFLLNALVGRLYRAGTESDAYFFACQAVVYTLIFSGLLRILLPAFTPVFIAEKNRRGDRAAWEFASTVLNLTLLGCAATLLVVYAFAEPITATLVRGFGLEARALGIRLLKLVMPGAALMLLYVPMRSILNSYKVFSYPSAAEATQKLLWAVGLYVTYRYLHLGIRAVAAGFLVGSVGMLAVTLLGARRHIAMYRPGFPALGVSRLCREAAVCAAFVLVTVVLLASFRGDLARLTVVLCAATAFAGQLWLRAKERPGPMARFAALAAPLLISTVFAVYRDAITFYFQSFTARGVFSDIEYARRIAFMPTTMVAYALGVAMFPYLCELASSKHHGALADVVTKAIRMLALGFVPLTVMTIILAAPVSRLVLDRGDWAQVHLHYTALALALLSLGLLMYAWEYVIMQGYFSLQRMWKPSLVGIAATGFQFAFLAVPIYVLRYDYPVQIFFLAALAYPVSRLFKDLILLALLRRHIPILPARPTLVFAGKLAALTAAIGLATYGTYEIVERRVPLEPHRQHKVVVDNFETGPDTWFSLNARDTGIVREPETLEVGERLGACCVMMAYGRHGGTQCRLYRRMDGIRTGEAQWLAFSLHSAGEMAGILVEVEQRGQRVPVFQQAFESPQEQPTARWREFLVDLQDVGAFDAIHWSEPASSTQTANRLYLTRVSLRSDGPDGLFWEEDFETNGWSTTASNHGTREGPMPRVTDTRRGDETPRHALAVTSEVGTTYNPISDYLDISGTTRFRCRLMTPGPRPTTATIKLVCPGRVGAREVALTPGEWETVDLDWEALGFESPEEFGEVRAVQLEVPRGTVYLDDVTFRRPPRRMYEVAKLAHCVVPTVAGLVVGALCLALLRFEEMHDIRQWIRKRGWRRRKEEAEEVGGVP